ncbi:MAG: hypothetical protein KF887_10255 [Paracoccaceae bacterium]|nr:MAG: hypothetical protein KF887_10255 [Paracoccaceae bacterium]
MADPAEDPVFDADEIGSLFKKSAASGNEFNFAFGLASKPDLCGLLVDLRKQGSVLKKQLKGSSKDIRKVCFGTFTVVSGDVLFRPTKPLKGLVKQLKKRFRDAGMMKYNPVMVDATGAPIDEDSLPEPGDDDDDDDAPPPAPPGTEAAAAPAADPGLKDRLVAIRARIEALPRDQTAQLVAAFGKAVALVRDGDPAAAATVETLERVLDRMAAAAETAPPAAPPPPPQPDAAARITAALAALVPRIRALPSEAQGPLAQAARAAQGLIASGDLAGAATAIRALAAALAGAESGAPADGAGPDPAAPLDIWNAAKEATDAGVEKLQQALRAQRHPATDRIAEFGLAGLSGGGVQTALMASLMGYARAPAEGREAAAQQVAAAVSGYRAFLSGNALVALCDENPFGVALDLRGTLGGALDRIEAAIAA